HGADGLGRIAGRRLKKSMKMVNLQGLVRLVDGCAKPACEPFKAWVAETVVTIQRDGCYALEPAPVQPASDGSVAYVVPQQVADALVRFEERNILVDEELAARAAACDELSAGRDELSAGGDRPAARRARAVVETNRLPRRSGPGRRAVSRSQDALARGQEVISRSRQMIARSQDAVAVALGRVAESLDRIAGRMGAGAGSERPPVMTPRER
ncbi:Bro-N domain-containing protein, partial [Streptomyces sp. NPDC006333]|uniref:BRO-N domain-containing protein n=1 Tax=Streptomyces sp. NPDC006333 TaxID=3156753 RepID=UPI0033BA1452